jgi:hypothetical protein
MPTRDAMRFLDGTVGPDPHAAIRGVLGLRGGNMHFELYHPWVRDVASAADLAALAAEARARGVRRFVSYGYPLRNLKTRPQPFPWLDDPVPVAFFHATGRERGARAGLHRPPLPPHLARAARERVARPRAPGARCARGRRWRWSPRCCWRRSPGSASGPFSRRPSGCSGTVAIALW